MHIENLKKYVIAITGGIATGKSEIIKYLQSQQYPTIDADYLARLAVHPEKGCLDKLIKEFGISILDNTGFLDRKKFAKIIFADSKNCRYLAESIIHPKIKDLLCSWVDNKIMNSNSKILFYEAALIFEKESQKHFKEVWLTVCSRKVQVERLMHRNKISNEQALNLISTQIDVRKAQIMADYIIDTEININQLRKIISKKLEYQR